MNRSPSSQQTRRPLVTIVHPWLPQYRVPFFEQLRPVMERENVDLTIAHGSVPKEWAARGDAENHPWSEQLETTSVRLPAGKSIIRRDVSSLLARRPDLIVFEQALRNVELYEFIMRRGHRKSPLLALWGHGRTYTKPHSAVESWAKAALTRRADWFFAYTEGGRQSVVDCGFPSSRVTVVRNSTDTRTMRTQLDSLSPVHVRDYRRSLGLRHGHTGLFIGGLDESKRISFLLESADIISKSCPDFRLLVAGDGNERSIVEAEAQRYLSPVHLLGRLSGEQKLLAVASCDFILMPGRVGLVAVDSFACGKPVVTTDWEWHAPEYEYLSPLNSLVTANDLASYAHGVVGLINAPSHLKMLQEQASLALEDHSIENMVANFAEGLLGALSKRHEA